MTVHDDSPEPKDIDQITLDAAAPLIQPHARHLATHLEELNQGGVDAVIATVASIENARTTIDVLGKWTNLEKEGNLSFRITTTVQEIRTAKREGRTAVILGFQGTHPIESDLNLIDIYHKLGIRVIQLTYNARCLVGDGCTEAHDGGLSDFGRQVVKRMQELGLVIDLSHVGLRTSLEALGLAQGPMIVSHANARGGFDSLRNLTDDQIKAVASTGGVIGVCAFPGFVSGKHPPKLEDLLNHVDYLKEMVGVPHIGIGLDFAQEDEDDYEYFGYDPRVYPPPPWTYPDGIQGFTDIPNIAEGLAGRGYSEIEVQGIMGENFLRVFKQVWGS